jgi:hypothetical protein
MKHHLPKLPATFVDPITGYAPTNEVQMSGLLGLLHQMGRVKWDKVPLLSPHNEPNGKMANELFGLALMCGEYQLFWNSDHEVRVWGAMPADLIAFSESNQTVTIIENKIGSGFTGERNDPAVSQLAKQLDFLLSCKFSRRALVLLSTTKLFNGGRYRNELASALRHAERETKVSGYLMRWEEVLDAVI